jgi:hypothetical protein
MSAPTTITPLTPDQFAARIGANFPPGWSSQTAKLPGGVLYNIFKMMGVGLSFEMGGAQYALDATRLATATGDALDLAAEDFFGTGFYAILRNTGELDPAYRARLQAAMLPTGATRHAVYNEILRVTGFAPRLIEPWRLLDVGMWDGPLNRMSFWDVDNIDNPFRWTTGSNPNAAVNDLSLAYQGFVECVLPVAEPFGNNPTPCLDEWTMAWDVFGAFMDVSNSVPLGEAVVLSAISRMKVEGTTVWFRFVPAPQLSWDQPGLIWDQPGLKWQ